MSNTRAAIRYAKSLIELAEEKKALEKVREDMLFLSSAVQGSRDFQLALTSPIIRNDKKLNILQAIYKGKQNKLTDAFFTIISKKNRENILPNIAEEFERQYYVLKGIQKALVSSTTPLNDELRKRFANIVAKATGKEIELNEEVDESLIGGYILRVGDKQIDESLSSKLKQIELEFNRS